MMHLQRRDFHKHGLSHDQTEENKEIGVLQDFFQQAKVKSLQTASSAPEGAPEICFFENLKAKTEELEGEVKDKNRKFHNLSKKTTELNKESMSRMAITLPKGDN